MLCMEYKKIKLVYKYAVDRLNRELLIRSDVNLIELASILLNSVYAMNEHDFMFRTSSNSYVLENYDDNNGQTLYMADYKLEDLGDHFEFIYDFGEDWEFECTVIGKQNKKGNQFAYALSGAGAGIFEDGRYFFDEYVNGNEDVICFDEEDERYEAYNLPFDYDDLDSFDVDYANYEFKHGLPFQIFEFIEEQHQLGLETNVKNIDLRKYLSDDEIDDYFDCMDDDIDDTVSEFDIVQKFILYGVEKHIEKLDYVKEAYERLRKKYDDNVALMMIGEVLIGELKDIITGDSELLDSAYKKKIRKLK